MAFGPIKTLRFVLAHPLGHDRPVASTLRYLRWQVGSRLGLGPMAINFVNDARLLVSPGMAGATGNVYVGLHEFEDMAFLLHVLRPEDLFVDVGANIGSYTILAAKAIGAKVVAFEPVEAPFAALSDNIALNAISGSVEAHRECVGSASGVVQMTSALDSVNHVLSAEEVGHVASQEVRVVRLDDALAGRCPFSMKLDVEGYELEVLKGAPATLGNPALQCMIMEINSAGGRYGREERELQALVTSYGFSAWDYDPHTRQLISTSKSTKGTGNTIFVRDVQLVQARLGSAKTFRVLERTL